ncbi:hypothetical protein J0H58_00915 [bacterium]|nr:hypothetical protein [bacterium]
MRLMQITYDVDSGTAVRAVLEGRDLAKTVTVTLDGVSGGRQEDDDEQQPRSSTPTAPLTPSQRGIAAAFGYQEDGPRAEPEPEPEGVFDWWRGGRS